MLKAEYILTKRDVMEALAPLPDGAFVYIEHEGPIHSVVVEPGASEPFAMFTTVGPPCRWCWKSEASHDIVNDRRVCHIGYPEGNSFEAREC